MMNTYKVFSPIDDTLLYERPYASRKEISNALTKANSVLNRWRKSPLKQKTKILKEWVSALESETNETAMEITTQIGRPISQSPYELKGFRERADFLLEAAYDALKPIPISHPSKESFVRAIHHDPLGVVLIIAPWNYPYLTVVNSLIPALLAGNTVILKHAPQTTLCADRMAKAAQQVGIPEGVFQTIMMRPEEIAEIITSNQIQGLSFTGSVQVGQTLQKLASQHVIPLNLELGGKDAAFVRPDAFLEKAANLLAEGAYFNSGQSCCSIERIYIHEEVYTPFIELFQKYAHQLVLGDPRQTKTTLGPVAREDIAKTIHEQIEEARTLGAEVVSFQNGQQLGNCYIHPHIIYAPPQKAQITQEETFGPVVNIYSVASDEDAIARINDSKFGLTASFWSEDIDKCLDLSQNLICGTVFLNRCDYLDPALPWTGRKLSGRGISLSTLGFQAFTNPKSIHFRKSLRSS